MARILLGEDDPVSRRFLGDALQALGHECVAAADGEDALAHACRARFELLLLDYNLPRRRGDALLADLRGRNDAASRDAPAIALTADVDPGLHRRLLEAGFARVAHKPIGLASFAALIESQLGSPSAPRWDDAAALRTTGGAPDIVEALRQLMLSELPPQRRAVIEAVARGDHAAARDTLHRLRAACGFCGATALAQRVAALDAALGSRETDARLAAFVAEVDALLG